MSNQTTTTGIVWRAGIILLIIFFCPLFLWLWAKNIPVGLLFTYLAAEIVMAAALIYAIGFATQRVQKIILSVLFVLSIFGNIVVWSNLYVTNEYMTLAGFWVIFCTNIQETSEYFSQFIDIINVIVAVLYIATGIFLIAKLKCTKRYSFKKIVNKIFFSLSIIAVILLVGFTYIVPAYPTFSIYYSFARFLSYNSNVKNMLIIKDNMQKVECGLQTDTPHTFVVVIGESASPYHQSIYGYQRETTPYQNELKKEGQLAVYADVLTPHASTRNSLEKVLSFANHSQPKNMFIMPNIVDIINANFKTYWVNNQEVSGLWQSPVSYVCSVNADSLIDLKSGNDLPVIETFYKLLQDTAKNKVIFIHLTGNHFAYKYRYPKEFEIFNAASPQDTNLYKNRFLSENEKQTINEYDNSILFGDYLLHCLIDTLAKTEQSAFLVFFSDHSEEIYEQGKFIGHNSGFYPTKYQVKIPFVLWRSEKYKSEASDILIDTSRPYNNEDFIHSLGTLMRLRCPYFDSARSIFSPCFTPAARMVEGREFVY